MRKNYSYTAVPAATRNEFIEAITNQKEAIVINHQLLKELTEEMNANLSSKKQGGFFKKISVPMAILSWSNPIGWALSGIVFLCGVLSSVSYDLKKYVIYPGIDAGGLQIMVLHHKRKVDLKYDEIIYPSFVKSVDYTRKNKKVRTK